METVVVERFFPERLSLADYDALVERSAWCFDTHRVSLSHSYMSADGTRVVCIMRAPDAEAVRRVQQQSGASYVRIWPASVHEPGAPTDGKAAPEHDGQELLVVERTFPSPVEFADIQATEDRSAWCLETYRVRFARSYFSRDRQRMLCLYRAPDAESVRLAQEKARMVVDRVWPASRHAP